MVSTHHISHSISITHFHTLPETCGTFGAIFSIFLGALTTEARSLAGASASTSPSLEFWGSATCAMVALQRSATARQGHRTVMDALIQLITALSTATMFGDAAEACKAGGEGTAGLTARLGTATYVTDTGNFAA